MGGQNDPLRLLALDHLRRGRPARPLGLATDALLAAPGKTFPAHPDAVLDRLATIEHEIEPALTGLYKDCAGRQGSGELDDLLAGIVGVGSAADGRGKRCRTHRCSDARRA